ncbi:MAG: NHL repeat-containing protein [Myxococcales bacterium]
MVTTVLTTIDVNGSVSGLAFDSSGNLYAASGPDVQNTLIEVRPSGMTLFLGADQALVDDNQAQPDGWPDAGVLVLGPPTGLAVARDGTLFLTESAVNQVLRIDHSGTLSVFAGTGQMGGADGTAVQAEFNRPGYLAVDPMGDVFVIDLNGMREIDTAGIVTTLARDIEVAGTMAADQTGSIYYPTPSSTIQMLTSSGQVRTLAGDGDAGFLDGPASSAQFSGPASVAVDPSGDVYVADFGNSRVRKIDAAGLVTTIAGDGRPCETAGIGGSGGTAELSPWSLAISPTGDIYVATLGGWGTGGPLMKIHFTP